MIRGTISFKEGSPIIRFLLFDLDDTLFDFRRAERTSLSRVLANHGHPPADRDLEAYSRININWWQKLERGEVTRRQVIVGRFGEFLSSFAPELNAAEVADEYEYGLNDCGFLLPGALKNLARLRDEEYLMYAVTNGAGDIQRSRIRLSGIGPYIRDFFISEEIGYEKPSPLFFEAAFRRIPGFCKSEAALIGDSLTSDIRGALNAGVLPVWFSPGKTPPEAFPPVRIIRSLDEIRPREWEQ
ncbi:MAG: YjjG family noncanonical pyrimidine nucleotidase [Clostridia bacterium]|nr:YjjG family noncanonical pyrimidine nucleotidase [Clostridia bacterium]